MEYFDGNNLWVSISDLNNQDIINDTSEKITDEAVEDSNCKLIPKGSLLFSFKLSVGHLAFAGSDLYTNEAIAAFRPSNRLNVRFLKYLLQIEFESNANTNIYGAYLFNKETLGTAKIVFPDDSKEQTAIANYLDEKTSKIDQLVHNLENQIEQLQEVRKIEIYNAVTGKIKTG
jgi:type I restriction enzyme S subunit